MFELSFDKSDYPTIVQQFADAMGVPMVNNRVACPPHFGDGFLELINMPNGLQAVISAYTINQDFFFQRRKSKEEFYVLRFDEIDISKSLTIDVSGDAVTTDKHVRAAALLTSSLFDFSYYATKGSQLRSIFIKLPKEWIATYLGINSSDEVLQRYFALKSASFNFEPWDAEYRVLITEILEEKERTPLKIMMIQNRMMLLVERFFSRLYEKMGKLKESDDIGINGDDIQRLMDAEVLLVKDFGVPAPTIAELSRYVAMSETKFKTQFKKIYGAGPYEYFQRNRMMRAKHLLLTRQYSVKEVGMQLGYNNLSNFTIAFKKEYGVLPSEV